MGWAIAGYAGGAAMVTMLVNGGYVHAVFTPLAGGYLMMLGDHSNIGTVSDLGEDILFSSLSAIPGGLIGRVVNVLGGDTMFSSTLGSIAGGITSIAIYKYAAYAARQAEGRLAALGRFI